MKSKMSRRKAVKLMIAGAFLPNLFGLLSCGRRKAEGAPQLFPKAGNSESNEAAFDFIDRISMAEIKRNGVFVDFGSADYFKYTLGKWWTGWGNDVKAGGVPCVEAAGPVSRVFFPWQGKNGAVLRLRLLPRKADSATLYVNSHPLSSINITGSFWREIAQEIPKGMLVAENNCLFIKWGEKEQVSDADTAALVEYIYIAEKNDSAVSSPSLSEMRRVAGETDFFGKKEKALYLAPGTVLSYHLRVPEAKLKPRLKFSAQPSNDFLREKDEGRLTVEALSDAKEKTVLIDMTFVCGDPAGWKECSADLTGFAGQAIRLDFVFSGAPKEGGTLIIAKPAVCVSGKISGRKISGNKRNGKKAKNVIFILVDTLRADHVNCYGKRKVITPALDGLAKEGAMFSNFSSVEDWTKPTIATILTGVYPSTHKAQNEKTILSDKIKLISENLREQNIKTGAFISNGYVSEKFGFKRGWDYYENYVVEGRPDGAESVFGCAADWIRENQDQRFFAYIHTIDAHVPYNPPKEFLDLYDDKPYDGPIIPAKTHVQVEDIKSGRLSVRERDVERLVALYDGAISYHDKCLDVFLKDLAEMNLLEDTLIIVTADHGEEFGEHGSFGHGHSLFQELVHVPFIAVWKGVIPKGKRIIDDYGQIAIAPTILDAFGLEPPAHFEGVSVLPKILGQNSAPRRPSFLVHKDYQAGVWSNNFKLQIYGSSKRFRAFLFNLETDPACSVNIYRQYPVTFHYMKTLLSQFMGASNKTDWDSSSISLPKNTGVEVKEVRWDDELKEQLKPKPMN
jgi:choline-sulfatase